jgi:hypothetical protein
MKHFDGLGFVCVYLNVVSMRRRRCVKCFGYLICFLDVKEIIVGEANMLKFRTGNVCLIITINSM